jgi:hypothetical protein
MNGKCSRCCNPPRAGQKYCTGCHAAYAREHRASYSKLTPEQRRRSNARSYANTYQRRGKLTPRPCEVCGSRSAQKHHPDYSRPLFVRWLCRQHHLALHDEQVVLEVAA